MSAALVILDWISISSSSWVSFSLSLSLLLTLVKNFSLIWNSVPTRFLITGSGSPGASGISGGSSPVNSPSFKHNSFNKHFFSFNFSSSASRRAFNAITISCRARLASSASSPSASAPPLLCACAKLCADPVRDTLLVLLAEDSDALDLVRSRAISFSVRCCAPPRMRACFRSR